MMFCVRRLDVDGYPRVLIRKDAVRFVEPIDELMIRLQVDGLGEVRTDTYDFDGFAAHVAGLNLGEMDLAE